MSIIHMDTERVRTIARAMHALDDAIARSLMSVNTRVNMIPWEGGSKDDFIQLCKAVDGKINSMISELVMLATRLSSEVNQWEEVSRTFEEKVTTSISPLIINPVPDTDFWGREHIGNVMTFFGTSEEAEALRQAAIEANITFVFTDEDGKKYYFGAINGEVVEVKWEKNKEMPGALGFYDPENMEISINNRMKWRDEEDLQGTLAHEMQHAIDIKTGRADVETIIKPYQQISDSDFTNMSEEELASYNWDSLENDLEASCSEMVKTEIAAHSRGYEMDDAHNAGEDIVNTDSIYDASEYEFVLEERPYAKAYQKHIEASLEAQGVAADVDVYWNDEMQHVEVNITNVSKKA